MNPALAISEVDILPVKPHRGLVAFASCVVNSSLFIGDIGVHATPDGLGYRLVYPLKTLANGKQINVVYPITKEAGETIRTAVVDSFLQLTEKRQC